MGVVSWFYIYFFPFFLSGNYMYLQDLDIVGKKDEDALEAMEGGGLRNGNMNNANEARIV